MIRYVVATVLLAYFLGADAFARYRPPVIGEAMRIFHHEINRGTWQIVGPSVIFLRDTFGSDGDEPANDTGAEAD
jgi:hypothetical protein